MGFNDDDRNLYALVICISFALFGICFGVGWLLSHYWFYSKVFRRLETRLKADWCSRINSTIHGVVVTVGFVATLSQVTYDDNLRAEYTTHLRNVRCFMGVSLGYFAFDLIVVSAFRVPLFGVFIVHHIVASTPFYMHLFAKGGDFGTLVLGSFLCVEVATVFLNVQSWCETIRGHRDSRLYRILFAMTYVSWIISRLFLPLFCLIVWWWFVLLDTSFKNSVPLYQVITYSICGHGIFVFCYCVFFFVLTPELIQICRGHDQPEAQRGRSKLVRAMAVAAGLSNAGTPVEDSGAEPFPGPDAVDDPNSATIHTAEEGGELPAPLRAPDLQLSTQTSISDLAEAAPSIRASLAAHSI